MYDFYSLQAPLLAHGFINFQGTFNAQGAYMSGFPHTNSHWIQQELSMNGYAQCICVVESRLYTLWQQSVWLPHFGTLNNEINADLRMTWPPTGRFDPPPWTTQSPSPASWCQTSQSPIYAELLRCPEPWSALRTVRFDPDKFVQFALVSMCCLHWRSKAGIKSLL